MSRDGASKLTFAVDILRANAVATFFRT
jgi:hypothetical protein